MDSLFSVETESSVGLLGAANISSLPPSTVSEVCLGLLGSFNVSGVDFEVFFVVPKMSSSLSSESMLEVCFEVGFLSVSAPDAEANKSLGLWLEVEVLKISISLLSLACCFFAALLLSVDILAGGDEAKISVSEGVFAFAVLVDVKNKSSSLSSSSKISAVVTRFGFGSFGSSLNEAPDCTVMLGLEVSVIAGRSGSKSLISLCAGEVGFGGPSTASVVEGLACLGLRDGGLRLA